MKYFPHCEKTVFEMKYFQHRSHCEKSSLWNEILSALRNKQSLKWNNFRTGRTVKKAVFEMNNFRTVKKAVFEIKYSPHWSHCEKTNSFWNEILGCAGWQDWANSGPIGLLLTLGTVLKIIKVDHSFVILLSHVFICRLCFNFEKWLGIRFGENRPGAKF
jgi:hypothetical protein